MLRPAPVTIAYAALSLALIGCGGSSAPVAREISDHDALHVRLVGGLYGDYMSSNGGAPPANEKQFIAYLTRQQATWSKLAATAEELLTSPRDHQPLVILYGAKVKDPPGGGFPWIAHEKTGVDGKMLAAQINSNAELKTSEEIAALFPSAS